MEFPNNSTVKPELAAQQIQEKKVSAVISSESAKIKKKSGFKKIFELFIAEDLTNVKNHIIRDVVVPTVQNTIIDTVSMLIKGERTSRPTNWSQPSGQIFNYNAQYYNPWNNQSQYNSNTAQINKPVIGAPYDEIEYSTKDAASAVLNELALLANQYKCVSILDLYTASRLSPQGNFTYDDYGWFEKDIMRATIARTFNGGWIINLPKPVSLK